MALSDQLTKLSTQAKSLEDSAAELHSKDKAKLQERLAELRSSLDEAQTDLDADVDAGAD